MRSNALRRSVVVQSLTHLPIAALTSMGSTTKQTVHQSQHIVYCSLPID
jgi:hypothetical protein